MIAGPIGSGKSTVAGELARQCATASRSVATADLDDVAFGQEGCLDLHEFWRRAGVAHVALVSGWLRSGVEVVIAHGPFGEAGSYGALRAAAHDTVRFHHVLLSVSVEDAQERVIGDVSRPASALSRDPEFLRSTHEAFGALDLPPCDEVFDTSRRSPSQIAHEIAARLSHRP